MLIINDSSVLVRQYFVEGFYPSGRPQKADSISPSSALLKAITINGAFSIDTMQTEVGGNIEQLNLTSHPNQYSVGNQ